MFTSSLVMLVIGENEAKILIWNEASVRSTGVP